MSRITKGVPKSGGIPRPPAGRGSSTAVRPQSSTGGIPRSSGYGASSSRLPQSAGGARKASVQEPEAPKEKKFAMPVLSTMTKSRAPKVPTELEKLRKKSKRRNAPEGEDLKAIKEIIRGMKDKDVTVQEFVGLVSPYTGDNGEILRTVMAEDLTSFRILAKKIYDTMSQDVSDVLANEHVQLTESYNEKHAAYSGKMMRAIDEIHEYVPDFDFERYYTDPNYLLTLFPLVPEVIADSDEAEALRRQEAYHRLQWLRSEGERLKEENGQLQQRFRQLKDHQKQEMEQAAEQERLAEERKAQLEDAQADLQEELQDLNDSVEQTLVDNEKVKTQLHAAESKGAVPKPRAKGKSIKKPSRLPWNVQAAQEIEEQAETDVLDSEVSKVSLAPNKSGTRKKTTRSKTRKPPPKKGDGSPFHFSPIKSPPPQSERAPKETSPFHFSPIKSPPPRAPKAASPFHFSPIKTPPERAPRAASPFHYSPTRSPPQPAPRLQTTRMESTTTVTEEMPPTRTLPPPRRGLAPRDSWGGYN